MVVVSVCEINTDRSPNELQSHQKKQYSYEAEMPSQSSTAFNFVENKDFSLSHQLTAPVNIMAIPDLLTAHMVFSLLTFVN